MRASITAGVAIAAAIAAGAVLTARAAPDAGAPKFDYKKAMAELAARVRGHEQEPAERVFKNIEVLKGVPAGRIVPMMQLGFARALGVRCNHCHVLGAWEKDDKKEKGVARRMVGLTKTINEELLPKIPDLESEKPAVNCTTCHRGEEKPALDVPRRRPAK
jgi:hypothetical protein